MNIWDLIGYSATLSGGISLLPELYKAFHTHHLKDVAWGMLFLMLTSSGLWAIYGWGMHLLPLIISTTINITAELALITLKYVYEKSQTPIIKTSRYGSFTHRRLSGSHG